MQKIGITFLSVTSQNTKSNLYFKISLNTTLFSKMSDYKP